MSRLSKVLSGLLATIAVAAPAAAMPVPFEPTNPAVAEQWVNPQIRPEEGGESGFTLSLIDAPSTTSGDQPVPVTVRVRNSSEESADNLTITPRRGPDSGSVLDARVATIAQPGEYRTSGDPVEVPALDPGEEAELTIEMRIGEQPLTSTFPLMLVLTSDGTIVDTERWHMTALGEKESQPDAVPAGMTVLYPISTPVDIVPGETGEAPNRSPLILSSEQLAEELAPDGRLDQLLDTYAEADDEVKSASCLALDPALVDTVERMSNGYTVDDDRIAPGEQRQRLRDSWGKSNAARDSTPGTGTEDAAAWLKKLRETSAGGCTVALPWANTDVNAVARTGDTWLMREALQRGPAVLEKILGQPVIRNVVVPGTGYITPEAAPAMGWADAPANVDLQAAWEEQQLTQSKTGSGKVDSDTESTLDSTTLPSAADVAAPAPQQPVAVLVADKTVAYPFATPSPGIELVAYNTSLAAVLAAAGERPATAGYTTEEMRFDYGIDSVQSRDLTAATAVRTAAQAAKRPEGTETSPTMVAPPAAWDVSTAEMVMDTVAELFAERTATPMSLQDYILPRGEVPVVDPGSVGTPYEDPSGYTDAEILSAGQQASFIDDLTGILANDKGIVLTRYGYTLPLRRDLLTALTVTDRRGYSTFTEAEQRTRDRLNASRDALSGIRSSISLIPPGNVYTRTSESSPLLIVAENGLPLPVDASIIYRAPEGAQLNTPAQFRIPARGSITLQMTAELPQKAENSELQLVLATPQHQAISQPVDIAVQTAGGIFNRWVLVAFLAGLFVLAVVFQLGKRRRGSGSSERSV